MMSMAWFAVPHQKKKTKENPLEENPMEFRVLSNSFTLKGMEIDICLT